MSRMQRAFDSCLRGVRTLCGARLTAFPSSATSGHPLSSARRHRGRIPAAIDGPIEALVPTTPREEHCLPENQDAFHRHDTRRSLFRASCFLHTDIPDYSITSARLRAGSLAHAAHTLFPGLGTSVFDGHCEVTVRSPADP
jgi:hypothetical protein